MGGMARVSHAFSEAAALIILLFLYCSIEMVCRKNRDAWYAYSGLCFGCGGYHTDQF